MKVNLTPDLEALVQRKVRSGHYDNQSEVVREALCLLAQRDVIREADQIRLRRSLDEGLEQADRGELLDGRQVVDELRAEIRARCSSEP